MEKALDEPARRIAENAGVAASVILAKIKDSRRNFGFNAATEQFEDLVEAGVIDPTKVVRTALYNGASVASLLITTEALVAEKAEKEPVPATVGE